MLILVLVWMFALGLGGGLRAGTLTTGAGTILRPSGILHAPQSKVAFAGDPSVTFEVVATLPASATYRWVMLTPDAATGVVVTELVNDGAFSGATGPVLTIANPGPLFDGRSFYVEVRDSSGTTVSSPAALRVVAAPSVVPVVAVTPMALVADQAGAITVAVSGLPAGASVRVDRFLDANGDGEVNAGEFNVQSATVSDGERALIGGVVCPLIPADDDGVVDGAITTAFPLGEAAEFARTAGNYLVRVSSPTGLFRPLQRAITLSQPGRAQTVSGRVTADGVPVAHAIVALFAVDEKTFLGAVVADASGRYSLNAPVGSGKLIGFRPGYVDVSHAVKLAGGQALADVELTLWRINRTIRGRLTNLVTGNDAALAGVQFFARSTTGLFSLTFSDATGFHVLGATAPLSVFDPWTIEPSGRSLNAAGYAEPFGEMTEANGFGVMPADAMIHGAVQAADGSPIAGASVGVSYSWSFIPYSGGQAVGSVFDPPPVNTVTTDMFGRYFYLARGDANAGYGWWFVELEGKSSAMTGFLPLSPQRHTLLAGEIKQVDFTVSPAPVRVRGRVTLDGVPLHGIGIVASRPMQESDLLASFGSVTDANGDYDLALTAGSWTIHFAPVSVVAGNVLSPVVTHTVADGDVLIGVNFAAKAAIRRINGSIRDWNGASFWSGPGPEVSATAIVGGAKHITFGYADGQGAYSLPVVDGAWSVFVPLYDLKSATEVAVAGGDVDYDVLRPAFYGQPADVTVYVGQIATFRVPLIYASYASYRWQTSTDGLTWTDLVDDTTHAGTSTETLTIVAPTLSFNARYYRLLATSALPVAIGSPEVFPSAAASTSARLTVNPVDTFAAWRRVAFSDEQLADPTVSGPAAAPAGDGVGNLLKYALGLPAWASAGGAAGVPSPVVSGDAVMLTFDAVRSDVVYAVEASTDLVNWTMDGVVIEAAGTRRTASVDTTGKPRVFLRLRITQ